MSEVDRGNALLFSGKPAEAEIVFRGVLAGAPDDAQALAGLGTALVQLGREDEAWDTLNRACRLADNLSHALSGLAWLALKRGNVAQAHTFAERTLALNPVDPNGLFVLAQALFRQSRFDEGERVFVRALRVNPGYAVERNRLGNEAFDRSEFDAAARHYAVYVQHRATDAKAWMNLGLSSARAKNYPQARTALEKASELAPHEIKPLAMLASMLRESGADNATLIPVYRKLSHLAPDAIDVLMHLARALVGEFNFPDAKECLRRVLQIDPNNLTARWLDFQRPDNEIVPDEASLRAFLSKWREGIAYFENVDWSDPQMAAQADSVLASGTDFYLAYLGQPLVEEQVRNARIVRTMLTIASPGNHEVPIRAIGKKRRKVAVFSPSLMDHSVDKVWSGSLLRLDPAEFELCVFCPIKRTSASSERWRQRGIRFEEGERQAGEWIKALQNFEPDIAIFLDIGMHQLMHAIASLRHAPVQVTTWAHPVTSGIATIDYFLSGDAFETANADSHYSETLVRLPRLGIYTEPPAGVLEKQRVSTSDATRFICTQSPVKLHPAHDELFADILQANPNSHLTLLSGRRELVVVALRERMRKAFERRGIDFAARCDIHQRMPLPAYHQKLIEADVYLDSLDFSGCLTTIDALWANLPIVTLPGQLMRGRQSMAMLRLIGLDDLIAQSTDDYVRIATRLANDKTHREDVVSRIRARKSELFKDETAVFGLADFLRSVEHPSVAS